MIESPKTLDDVRCNIAEMAEREVVAAKVKLYEANGCSPGQAEFAANEVMPGTIKPQDRDPGDVAARLQKLKNAGLTEGQAEFAAEMILPG